MYQSFIKVKKVTEKASEINIRRGMESAPLLVLARKLYTFKLVITINQKNVSRLQKFYHTATICILG